MIELSIFLLLLINLVTSLRLHKSISNSLCIDHYKTALHDSKHSPSPSKKFIVVTGGVISGIGKGITASSIGVLLKMLKIALPVSGIGVVTEVLYFNACQNFLMVDSKTYICHDR